MTNAECAVLYSEFSENSTKLAEFITKLTEFTAPRSEGGTDLTLGELEQLRFITRGISETSASLHNLTECLYRWEFIKQENLCKSS